jgi:trehalose/maltose hydrolase-like predicted phosphorylase
MKKTLLLILLISIRLQAQDAWKITALEPQKCNPYYGVTLANGMLGLVSSQVPFQHKCLVLNGVYDKFGRGNVSNYFENVDPLNAEMSIDGQAITTDNISKYTQTLDMQRASLSASFVFGQKASISYEEFALRELPHSALMVVNIHALKDCQVTFTNRHKLPKDLRISNQRYVEMHPSKGPVYLLSTDAKSPTGKWDVTASSSFIFAEKPYPSVSQEKGMAAVTLNLHRGQDYKIGIVGSLLASNEHPDVQNEADRMTIFAALEGIDRLVNRHVEAWKQLWKGDIVIEDNPQVQQDVHSMLYHLYSFVKKDSRKSISPMGLSGLGYNGHIFWDADIWMFPALLVLHPELAKAMVDYRIDRLQAARQNASAHGFEGAMYPWESSDTGLEETPTWALTGTFEHHITGCVALAAWNYYRVTQDSAWLQREAWPLLQQTADFWASRIETDDHGKAHIRNVVCADEYAENVDDNAFTNAIAMLNLRIAIKAAGLTNHPVKAEWLKYADALPITQMQNGVTAEYAGYNGQAIKQADVNLLAYPLGFITDSQQIERDMEYYAKKVPHDDTPAMTESIFALLYSQMGNTHKAAEYFKSGYEPNLLPPFRVLAECKGGTNPYFATGAGGELQAVIFGFGGYEITDKGLIQKPATLPEGWKGLKIKRAE